MMTLRKYLGYWISMVLMMSGHLAGFAQMDPNFTVSTASGKYCFNYNQIPDALIQVVPPIPGLPSDIGYQWEQSYSYLGPFVPAPSGGQATYTFTVPLSQTTYYRQKVVFNGGNNVIYSNLIKLQLVSINWEDINYLRQHNIEVSGVADWQTIDQLPIGQKMQTTTYSDGMGRPLQTIDVGVATPDPAQPDGAWGDLVKFSEYDNYFRQPKKYLPYTTTAQPGAIKADPIAGVNQYYAAKNSETAPFIGISFENTPLSRETIVNSPGASWTNSHGKVLSYLLNDETENVQIFTITTNGGDIPVSQGAYPSNTLYKTVHTDENNKQNVVYTDMEGRVILTKEQIDDNPSTAHNGWKCIYNIYDDFGRLRCTIQADGVKWLDGHFWSFASNDGMQVLSQYCFRYEYDEKGRGILKKSPGVDELYLIYDKRDRLIFNQDGNQRAKPVKEWSATLYDDLDRVVLTGLYETSKTRSQLQTDIDNSTVLSTISVPSQVPTDLIESVRVTSVTTYVAANSIEFDPGFETLDGDELETLLDPNASGGSESLTVYNNPVPSSAIADPNQFLPLTFLYYDNYDFPGAKEFDNGYNNGLAYPFTDPNIVPIVATQRTLGLKTGAKVRVLGTNNFLSSTSFYDDRATVVQKISDNILSGVDIATFQYHFDGRIVSSDERHSAAGTSYSNFDILTRYIFDKIGRLTSLQKKVGGNDFKTISAFDFDDMGRIQKKHLDPGYAGSGKSELESLAYTYNMVGKLCGINKDYALKTAGKYDKWGNFFGQYLGFDNRDGVFTNSRLDGKIAGAIWNSQGDDAQRKYEFSYDNVGRLTNAVFNQKQALSDSWSNSQIDFSVSGHNGRIEYDLNGNIQYMLHKGVAAGTQTPSIVDDLQYTYANLSNRLTSVTDFGNLGSVNGTLGDFKDGTNSASVDDYVYDNDGNLVVDLNKNITQLSGAQGGNGILYNCLDKPEQINIQGKGVVRMIYAASGALLQRMFTPVGGGAVATTSYINSFVYRGTDLQAINFEEGRIRVMTAYSQSNGADYLALDGNIDLPGGKRGVYDYFIRDYQNNIRMILTEEAHQGSNTCSLESDRDGVEAPLFGRVDASGVPTVDNEVRNRFPVANIPGQSSSGGWQNSAIGNYVSRLGSNGESTVGPNVFLRVMAGDKVSARTMYYYSTPTQPVQTGTVISNVLTALGSALLKAGTTTSLVHNSLGNVNQNLSNSLGGNLFVDPGSTPSSAQPGAPPSAFLYVLFFDERMNFLQDGSMKVQVSQPDAADASLTLPNVKAPKNGYAFVYVCNGSDPMVYFDNLQVTLDHGAILEENHYYPYGLKIAAISSDALPDPSEGVTANNYLYNGKELITDGDLDWYSYGYRNYDPQIGRFIQSDPLSANFPYLSPYQYASCDPVLNVDIDGLEGTQTLETVVVSHVRGAFYGYKYFLDPAISLLKENGTRYLENFGNNAVIYAYFLGTQVLWSDKHDYEQIWYPTEGGKGPMGLWTYLGDVQISVPPTQAERMAAMEEKARRLIDPAYGVFMGIMEGAHDFVLGTLSLADPSTRGPLYRLNSFLSESTEEQIDDTYEAIVNFKRIDFHDPTVIGHTIFTVGTLAIPFASEAGIAGELGEGAALTSEAASVASDATATAAEVDRVVGGASGSQALDGSFSIWKWEGYPEELPRPPGPFRLLFGEEYETARAAANKANNLLRKEYELTHTGLEIHEIQPVKFNGDPIHIENKTLLLEDFHRELVTPWWNKIQLDIEPYVIQ
jgi:RHS repeat-associated protein